MSTTALDPSRARFARVFPSGFAARFHDLTYSMAAAGAVPLFTTHVLSWLWLPLVLAVLASGYAMDTGRIPRISSRVFWITATAMVAAWVAAQVPDQSTRFNGFLFLILYLQGFRLLNPKRNREYVQVHLLAFFQVLITTALSPNFSIAPSLFVFMVTSTWALMALTLKRGLESEASFTRPGREESMRVGAPTPADGLVRPGNLAATAAIALGTFLVTFPIFYAIPRIGTGFFMSPLVRQTLITGFNEEVNLGAIGEVESNNALAMRIQLDKPEKLSLLGKIRYVRGVALNEYDGRGKWKNSLEKGARTPKNQSPLVERDFQVGPGPGRRPTIAYQVYQEPIGTNALFGFPVPFQLLVNSETIKVDSAGSLSLPRLPGSTIVYTVQSFIDEPDPNVLRSQPTRYESEIRQSYLRVPDNLDPRVGDLAREITAGITNPYDQAVAVRDYLERNYVYTLDLVRDKRLGPLEDFLFVQKRGHCEYFATAQAILLRTLRVPTRLVNGFLQGEWNSIGGYLIVRESDAHSWTEVYFPGSGWVTFDPSPRSIAEAVPAATAGENAFHLLDAIRMSWNRYVLAFTATDQRHAFEKMVQVYASNRWLRSPDPMRWWKLNVRSGGSSSLRQRAGAAVMIVALAIAAWNLYRSPRERWRRRRRGDPHADAVVASGFYREMLERLAKKGIAKAPTETPREFSASVGHTAAEAAPAVQRITALFERVRYAGERLEDRDLANTEADLRALARLPASKRRTGSPPPARV